MTRRDFLRIAGATTAAASLNGSPLQAVDIDPPSRIDRKSLVERHTIVMEQPDALSPLSVGNGEIAFTVDVTGLQTFPAFHQAAMPLHTMAQWAWHETPNSHGYKLSDTMEKYDSHGRTVPYARWPALRRSLDGRRLAWGACDPCARISQSGTRMDRKVRRSATCSLELGELIRP